MPATIQQIYTKCLAQGAYFLMSESEAIVIDPLREVEPYLTLAEDYGVKIKYILETHFHADFVSGHLHLAEATGATIVFGPEANPTYEAHIAKDGEELSFGKAKIRVLHTPGHTMESTTYALLNQEEKVEAIFTGDTLFLGDVGRPDLAQKGADLTMEELAGILYDSLRDKIMPLGDEVIVYPAHGAGSACGKNMSTDTFDTLGNQKRENYALRADMTKEEFIQEVTDGIPAPPAYFPQNVGMNKHGYDTSHRPDLTALALSIDAFKEQALEENIIVLDVRSRDEFVQEFIPGSLFIGLDGQFAPWVGSLLKDVHTPILLVANPHQVEEAVMRLARVGFDHVQGYLDGGIAAWKASGGTLDSIASVSANAIEPSLEEGGLLLDVRKDSEFTANHVVGAVSEPLDYWIDPAMVASYPNNTTYVHCAGGYRSVIACSLLKKLGLSDVINVEGGMDAIALTPIQRAQSSCL
ncbi:MAG: MBL fold metallo-hydrolase [Chitinophagales bacterium]